VSMAAPRGQMSGHAITMDRDGHGPWEGRLAKGGEALAEVVAEPITTAPWRVLWTRSNCEQLVHDQLVAKGFDLFLPQMESWSKRGGVKHRERSPMFRGYLFVRHAVDKLSYLEICKARGLVRMLGERWDRLEVVPNEEVEAIQKLAYSGLPILAHPYLREGQRVRITNGPLANVEGIVVRINPKKGLLVVSVGLLRRSVAVQLDCTILEAA
jgi:transcription termination/antitermination protein NusG